MKNPIIAELRRIRDAHAKRYNYDIKAMAHDLTQLEPWMQRKSYTIENGRLVPLTSLPHEEQRRKATRKPKVARRK